MRRFVVLSVLALGVICSCSPKVLPAESRQTIETVRERVVHDTLELILPPPVSEKAVTQERSSHLENEWAQSDASVDSLGLLHHSLETKPHEVKAPTTTVVRDTLWRESEVITRTEYVDKPLRWYQEALMWAGVVLIAGTAARMLKWIVKK